MRFTSFEHMLSHWAEQTPDAPALRFGDQTLSFAQLHAAVEARASELRESGKACLGVLADGSADCVVTIFGAVRAGIRVVLFNAALPEAARAPLIAYTDVDLLWSSAARDRELSAISGPGGAADGENRILFFTSGTTERAKAVVLTDHSLCQSAYNGGALLPLSPGDTLLCVLPLDHVFGFVCGLLWGLSCGACVALGRGPRHYIDDLAHYCPTAVSVVPAMLAFLMRHKLLNPELRLILIGAGDCPTALVESAKAAGKRVCFGYGLTETSSGVALGTGDDPYAMDVCPDDEITLAPDGEVLISAPTCMMQGYYKRPEDTAAVLKDGVLHTGDIGFFDEDGRLHISGRKKDILVLPDGNKIFLPEYEAELAAVLDGQDLAVTMQGEKLVLVCHGAESASEILEKLEPVMARKPLGQRIGKVLFSGEPLPRTQTGKIKRWELQQKAGTL